MGLVGEPVSTPGILKSVSGQFSVADGGVRLSAVAGLVGDVGYESANAVVGLVGDVGYESANTSRCDGDVCSMSWNSSDALLPKGSLMRCAPRGRLPERTPSSS